MYHIRHLNEFQIDNTGIIWLSAIIAFIWVTLMFARIMWVSPVSTSPVNKRNPNFVTIAPAVVVAPASTGTVLNEETVMFHDDVIKWKHFPRYWLFVRGIHRSPVNSPHKGQWRGALMFSMLCALTNDWVNSRDVGDLKAIVFIMTSL